jgi:bifunctional UDP-N-acetylglucosamine pyrophosphorylase/glucosamine-1-phosphate N-acetyltransferase
MQAILLAAGVSSRLYPFSSQDSHKSSLTLMGKPIIQRTIESIRKSGIFEIIIVVSSGSDTETVLKKAGVDLEGIDFVTHENAEGMGEALLDAKHFIKGDFMLLHAHHFECDSYIPELKRLRDEEKSSGAIVVRAETNTASFGVVRLDGARIVEVVEKPEISQTDAHRIVGMYLLPQAFLETLKKTPMQHYSFETALNEFVKKEHVIALKTEQETVTFKYPWHILSISDFLLSKLKPFVAESAQVAKSVVTQGTVHIGENVRIEDGVVIKGSCFIGDNAYVGTNAILRGGVVIEEGAVIGAMMEVKQSVIMKSSTTHSGFIGDSVIGKDCKIAAFFCTGNVRIDRQSVKTIVKGEKIDTERKSLGIFMGDRTRVGIRVSTMPGVIIGRDVTIGPSTTVYKNIADTVSYYTTLKEIIEEKKPLEKKEKIILFDIDYTLFDTARFKESDLLTFVLYDEVISVLTSLGQQAVLGIFSEGKTDLQQTKLLKTAINTHFAKDHVHIVESKDATITEVFAKYEGKELFFIDDKLPVLYEVKKKAPFAYTIWLKRGPFAKEQAIIDGFTPDATIDDLTQVLPLFADLEKE